MLQLTSGLYGTILYYGDKVYICQNYLYRDKKKTFPLIKYNISCSTENSILKTVI
jgi:hypothetical protein